MLNDRSSTLSLLHTRRSARPRDLVGPGPSEAELAEILEIAARSPDHGKLAPWRFIRVGRDARPRFHALLKEAYLADRPEAGRLELEAVEQFAFQAPALIVVLSSTIESKIPLWEQQLSCGAATMNLLLGTHALGYAAGWVTGWAAYSDKVREAFGGAHERIAGFVFIGTAGAELEERPRPILEQVAPEWPAT